MARNKHNVEVTRLEICTAHVYPCPGLVMVMVIALTPSHPPIHKLERGGGEQKVASNHKVTVEVHGTWSEMVRAAFSVTA